MKIISKFKDYYDYLQGEYGIDEKVVFDRRSRTESFHRPLWQVNPFYKPEFPATFFFAICGTIYVVYYFEGKLYSGESIEKLPGVTKHDGYFNNTYHYRFNGNRFGSQSLHYHKSKTNLNKHLNIPICLIADPERNEFSYEGWKIVATNIRLEDFGFSKFIPAKEMYIMLSTFLSKEPEVKNKQTDKEKIVSHGFDLKRSFRKM